MTTAVIDGEGRQMSILGPGDPIEVEDTVNVTLLDFFGKYLRGEPAGILDGRAAPANAAIRRRMPAAAAGPHPRYRSSSGALGELVTYAESGTLEEVVSVESHLVVVRWLGRGTEARYTVEADRWLARATAPAVSDEVENRRPPTSHPTSPMSRG